MELIPYYMPKITQLCILILLAFGLFKLDLEELEEEELTLLKQKYVSLARAARDKAKQGKPPRSRKAKPAPPE